MTITEISNLFNLITSMSPNLTSYHYGWASDINQNITNNYDNPQSTGRMFPHVQWIAPAQGEWSAFEAQGQRLDSLNITLAFYDLMDRNNDGSLNNTTMNEQVATLHNAAFQFMVELRRAGRQLAPQKDLVDISQGRVRWTSDANIHNDKLISVVLSFTLVTNIDCDELNLDFNTPPAGFSFPVDAPDYERTN